MVSVATMPWECAAGTATPAKISCQTSVVVLSGKVCPCCIIPASPLALRALLPAGAAVDHPQGQPLLAGCRRQDTLPCAREGRCIERRPDRTRPGCRRALACRCDRQGLL